MTAAAQSRADIDSAEYSMDDTTGYSPESPENFVPARNAAQPTKAQWDSLTSGKEFGYKDEREFTAEKRALQPPKVPAWLRALYAFFHFFTTTAGVIVLFAILAVIVFIIMYGMVSGNGGFFAAKNKSIHQDDGAEALSEDDLLESDWEEKMQAAMQKGEYRLAIRFGYLLMLQMLQGHNLILYRQDKTNTEYFRELAKNAESLRPGFRTLTRAYEWAWYGGRPSSKEDAEDYFNTFNLLKSGIQ